MYKAVEVIEVRIWGRTVGAVARDPALGFYAFEYDPAFVRTGIELAPLTMPLGPTATTTPKICHSCCVREEAGNLLQPTT